MQLRGVVLLLLILTGCATARPEAATSGPAALSIGVPFYPQEDYQCGPAALAMTLGWSGHHIEPADLVREVFTAGRNGSLQPDLVAATRRHDRIAYVIGGRDELLAELAAGNPVIVLQNLGALFDGWHYAVAVGYDYKLGMLILRSGITEREEMPFGVNEFVWKRSGYWAMVAVPPERIPATADEKRWLSSLVAFERVNPPARNRAAYAASLKRWPESVDAAVGLANAHYALGELPQAEAVLRGALGRAPDSVVVLNNLAQTLSDLGRNAEALPLIERAAAAGGPHAAAVQETRQGILKKLGR
jgi:tetratricopeptide (TPR) repeat protein